MTRVALAICGEPEAQVQARAGDYLAWFRRSLPQVDLVPFWAYAGESPSPGSFDGVLLSGAPCGVYEGQPWMKALAAWALDQARGGTPVLGVCFGHQLLADALGGQVTVNPSGEEYQTSQIGLTTAGLHDPVFRGVSNPLRVNQLHGDHINTPPAGAIRLAGNDQTPWQAFRADNIVGVQFHPEVDRTALHAVLDARGGTGPRGDGSPGKRVLLNWVGSLAG